MNWRQLLFIPPILVGVAIFYMMTRPDGGTGTGDPSATAVAVRVAELQRQNFIATAVGFGRVEATQTWAAISQVDGRV